jgi:hypothetical protein
VRARARAQAQAGARARARASARLGTRASDGGRAEQKPKFQLVQEQSIIESRS